MSLSLFRSSCGRSASRLQLSTKLIQPGMASLGFVRSKATLPDLPYDYAALEPAISGQIMELHHKKHHQTYVNSFNDATEQFAEASSHSDVTTQMNLLPLLNFHGGGHRNHSLFWENLAPTNAGGGEPPSGALKDAIDQAYGGLDHLKTRFNGALASIQGSGWTWLVKDKETGHIAIRSYPNQNTVAGKFVPLLGIDAWEHAYYLQYQNRKAEYFSAIWDVINWKAAERRFDQAS